MRSVHSMTGFGYASTEKDNLQVSCEIKSLNSRFLDLHIRIPLSLKEKELNLRKYLGQLLSRGKIELNLLLDNNEPDVHEVDQKSFYEKYRSLESLAKGLGLNNEPLFTLAMNSTDIWSHQNKQFDESLWPEIKSVIVTAAEELMIYRQKEGEGMAVDLKENLNNIQVFAKKIKDYSKNRKQEHSAKLKAIISANIREESIDENRTEQEILFYIEKWDINEELVRLESHCDFFIEILNNEIIIKGKKLNFITQEIGREVNTIGSKANNINIQKDVVEMKSSLEKIKEMVLNIL
ncbi:MAG TPA: YicC family protein [Bacteroidetes bacterium]|nr:YicC family protein [Bacteroidota bacterium]